MTILEQYQNYQNQDDGRIECLNYDDGRIECLSEMINADGSSTYKAILNIFPYSPITIPYETFLEWKKFCESGDSNEKLNVIIYKAKHWSRL